MIVSSPARLCYSIESASLVALCEDMALLRAQAMLVSGSDADDAYYRFAAIAERVDRQLEKAAYMLQQKEGGEH
jgi:hypothetical protein